MGNIVIWNEYLDAFSGMYPVRIMADVGFKGCNGIGLLIFWNEQYDTMS